MNEFGVRPIHFGFYASMTAIAMLIGTPLNGILVKKLGMNKMLLIGWSIILSFGLTNKSKQVLIAVSEPAVTTIDFLLTFIFLEIRS